MTPVLAGAAVASIIGVRGLVGQVSGTARQLHRESVTIARLHADLVKHEEIAHQLLSTEPADRSLFVDRQHAIEGEFAAAVPVFPVANDMRATIVEA